VAADLTLDEGAFKELVERAGLREAAGYVLERYPTSKRHA
jgi:hypothetical protein